MKLCKMILKENIYIYIYICVCVCVVKLNYWFLNLFFLSTIDSLSFNLVLLVSQGFFFFFFSFFFLFYEIEILL